MVKKIKELNLFFFLLRYEVEEPEKKVIKAPPILDFGYAKPFLALALVIMFAGISFADSDLGIYAHSDQDMNINAYFEAEGTMTVNTNLYTPNGDITVNDYGDDYITEIKKGGMTDEHVASLIYMGSMAANNITDPGHYYTDAMESIGYALDQGFVTTNEQREIYKLLNNLNVRVTALEKTIDEMNHDLYCKYKVDVTQEYGLSAVDCGDITYYNKPDSPIPLIGIRKIPVINETVTNSTYNNETNSTRGV